MHVREAPNSKKMDVIKMKKELFYGIFLIGFVILLLFFSGCTSNENPVQTNVKTSEISPTLPVQTNVTQVVKAEITPANVTVNLTAPVNKTPQTTLASVVPSTVSSGLVILTTDAFSGAITELKKAFTAENPGIVVTVVSVPERKIMDNSNLLKRSDIIVGFEQITGNKLVSENITGKPDIITRDGVVIAWDGTKNSVEPLNDKEWYYSLFKKGVRIVIVNPLNDPLGANALSALHLSDRYYGLSQIFPSLIERESRIIKTMSTNIYTINVTFPLSTGKKLIFANSRPDAVAFIKNGTASYGILSRSVAEQNGLFYMSLPPQIDLSDPSFSKIYNTVAIRYFAGTKGKETIEPLNYEIAFPVSQKTSAEALKFGEFIKTAQARSILQSLGYNSTTSFL